MNDFAADMQSIIKPSFPFLDVDPNMELVNLFPEQMNSSILGSTNLNFQTFMSFSNENFLIQQAPEFLGNFEENFPGILHADDKHIVPVLEPIVSDGNEFHGSRKRKAMDVSESSSGNYSSPPVSEHRMKRKNSSGRGKRVKRNEKEEKKPNEVVHVRARRGHATDSHSLAERARRGKINERLKCLQDIVPGCYKTMGMALMLDEIINYVQSLQNQVEFLSMKLTAASTFYDFNSEIDTIETMQRAKAYEAQKLQRLMGEGCGLPPTQAAPFDLTFGCYPS